MDDPSEDESELGLELETLASMFNEDELSIDETIGQLVMAHRRREPETPEPAALPAIESPPAVVDDSPPPPSHNSNDGDSPRSISAASEDAPPALPALPAVFSPPRGGRGKV